MKCLIQCHFKDTKLSLEKASALKPKEGFGGETLKTPTSREKEEERVSFPHGSWPEQNSPQGKLESVRGLLIEWLLRKVKLHCRRSRHLLVRAAADVHWSAQEMRTGVWASSFFWLWAKPLWPLKRNTREEFRAHRQFLQRGLCVNACQHNANGFLGPSSGAGATTKVRKCLLFGQIWSKTWQVLVRLVTLLLNTNIPKISLTLHVFCN